MNPFTLEHLPMNVRVQMAIEHLRLPDSFRGLQLKLGALASRFPLFPATGRARYANGRSIAFNGRNRQFHALWEDCYRLTYEAETSLLITLTLKGSGTFVDVGSNWGWFALLATAIPAFTGTCLCFEPNPEAFADLQACIQQAGVADRISARAFGVGREISTRYLQLSSTSGSGRTQLTTQGCGSAVSVTTLDAENIEDVAWIKIDVEGMEFDVLLGAQHTIARCRPMMIVENFLDHGCPDNTLAPIRWLEQNGYAVLAPAMLVKHQDEWVPHHYGSPPVNDHSAINTQAMTFLRVTPANRFFLSEQLNLTGCPVEKLAALPGKVLA